MSKAIFMKYDDAFRVDSMKLREAVRAQIDAHVTERVHLIDELVDTFETTMDAVVALTAANNPDNQTQDVLFIRSYSERLAYLDREISYLNIVVENITAKGDVFYDVNIYDAKRLGL